MVSKTKKNRANLASSVSLGVIALFAISSNAIAQETKSKASETVIITGSSIKRKVLDSALPIQIYTKADLERDGIVTAEQFLQNLNSNGDGATTLQSNNDVIDSGQRTSNGMSSANLRGQGAGATLVLLNGRRVAAHGLSGAGVDVNQIPMAAIERIDVLKDGASAIYGTDAIGGVINYITKNNYQGGNLSLFMDKTQDGGGDIYRGSLAYGIGDLKVDKYNFMFSASATENRPLYGNERDFTNGFQPRKGMSIDTGGTPFATIFTAGPNSTLRDTAGQLVVDKGTLFSTSASSGVAPLIPGTNLPTDGVNILDLSGGQGCNIVPGMAAYDELIFNKPERALRCSWDTAANAAILQEVKKNNFIARGGVMLGEHQLSFEAMTSHTEANKQFSNYQITSTGFLSYFRYLDNPNDPDHGYTKESYDRVYNALVATFPSIAGTKKPIAYRWRCDVCGKREISTETDTKRFLIGLDGPFGDTEWNYRTGYSYAESESVSTLGDGYYFTASNTALGIIGLRNILNDGYINPFLLPGEKQSEKGLDLLKKASAKGFKLFGGKFGVTQFDGSASGPLFDLPGGKAYGAVGFDARVEEYTLDPKKNIVIGAADPFLAPVLSTSEDKITELTKRQRNINAIFGELALPLMKDLELTLAARMDRYDGFGTTTNPKISLKYKPFEKLLLRGSYNTGFRVPAFSLIYQPSVDGDLSNPIYADPAKCPGGMAKINTPGCESIITKEKTGGKSDLGPETAKQYSYGFVLEPIKNYSVSFDYWFLKREDTIGTFQVNELFQNYDLFADKFIRNLDGSIAYVDRRTANIGATKTSGLDVSVRGSGDVFKGRWSAGVDGTYLLGKKSKRLPNSNWGTSEVGFFTYFGDLGLEWKHTAYMTYRQGDWLGSVSQVFKKGYKNNKLAGELTGGLKPPEAQENVDNYVTYNASLTYKGFKNFVIVGGIKNIFNTDPPFAITYNPDLGSGGSWESRVADPRGRAFTLSLEYKF